MKRISLFIVLIALVAAPLFAGDYPEVSVGGRIYLRNVYEDNMDFTEFDSDTGTGNDQMGYAEARVDVNFKAKIWDNVMAAVSTRFEGKGNGDKWMEYGKDGMGGGDQLSDAITYLQEAYVGIHKIFGLQFLNVYAGRKTWNYGAKNIVSDKDKLDGTTFQIKMDGCDWWINLHSFIRTRNAEFATVQEDSDKMLLGLVAGMTMKDLGEGHFYFWNQYEGDIAADDAETAVYDSDMVVGFRFDGDMDMGMSFMPFLEFAYQMGTDPNGTDDSDDDVDTAAMLVEIGSGIAGKADAGKWGALLDIIYTTGDDVETEENESWSGVGLANNEQGWMDMNVPQNGDMMMAKLGGWFSPAQMSAWKFGLNFWMFMDTTAGVEVAGEEVSGGTIYNEVGLCTEYKIGGKAKIKMGFNYLMPGDENLAGGEDGGMALWNEIQVKW